MRQPTTPQGILITAGAGLAVLFLFTATGAYVYVAILLVIAVLLYLIYTIGAALHWRFTDWLAGRR